MAGVVIEKVESKAAEREFLELPYRLYREDPLWVPPLRTAQKELLDARKHPFYQAAAVEKFLARRDGRVMGRIAAILNRSHNAFHGKSDGFFGFLELENDAEAAGGLLNAARNWLRERGATVFRGPCNPSTNHECGLLVDGFDTPPMVMMTHNPPWYAELMEEAGWRKAMDLYAYQIRVSDAGMEKVLRVAGRSLDAGRISLRAIRMGRFWEEVDAMWHVYNAAWERNWGYTPMSRGEFLAMAKEMKPVIDPEFVILGEVDGKLAGFALAMPDLNQAIRHAGGNLLPWGLLKILYHKRSIRASRVIALGVLPQYRTRGVAAAFYSRIFDAALRRGTERFEFSWILENNTLMNRALQLMGAVRYKTYRIYEAN